MENHLPRVGSLFIGLGSAIRSLRKLAGACRRGDGGSPDFFVIFSLSRCGSTTLHRALNLHPHINCVYEPDLGPPGQPLGSLKARLRGLRRRFSGMKHVWDPNGFPFVPAHISRLSEMEEHKALWLKLNKAVLSQPRTKVIFLRRLDVFSRTLSDLIGQQTQVWGPSADAPPTNDSAGEYRSQLDATALAPIDEAIFAWYLKEEPFMTSAFRGEVETAGTPCFDLTYEELFGHDTDLHKRVACIHRLVDFLGYSPMSPTLTPQLEALLSPLTGKLNSEMTYERVPNLAALGKRFRR